MNGYDILGNIAIVKFERKATKKDKEKQALQLLKEHKSVTSVFEKVGKFSGRLRTLKTRYVAGIKSKEVIYRENGCTFRLNVDTCYFSPRLANERDEIAKQVKKVENVLVMFGGVAPFAIVIGKNSSAKKVVSIELSRACTKYALENVKRNKLSNVEIIQGDVRRICQKMKKEKFDRIVMSRPNLKDSFLDCAFPLVKRNGIIHYYGFYEEINAEDIKVLIVSGAKMAKKKIKILKMKKAGDIGMRKYRYRVDFKVLN